MFGEIVKPKSQSSYVSERLIERYDNKLAKAAMGDSF